MSTIQEKFIDIVAILSYNAPKYVPTFMRKGTHDILPSKSNKPVIISEPSAPKKPRPKKRVNVDGINMNPTKTQVPSDFAYLRNALKRISKKFFTSNTSEKKRSLITNNQPSPVKPLKVKTRAQKKYKSVFENATQASSKPFGNLGLDTVKDTGFSRYQTGITVIGIGVVCMITLNLMSAFGLGMNTKDNVLDNIYEGYHNILDAKDFLMGVDLVQAEQKFTFAYDNFEHALKNIQQVNQGVSIFDGSPLDTSYHLLTAGEQISQAGINISKSLQDIVTNQNFKSSLEHLDISINSVISAQEHINEVSMQEVPARYRDRFIDMQTQLDELMPIMQSIKEDLPTLKKIVGDDYPRRYFIAFQDTTEARGLGGFLGSYGILDMEEGKITQFSVNDVYDIDWQLFEDVPAPEGLQPYMKNLKLRDSNYLPDTAEAAQYIRWFYEHSRGTSFDGLIVIDQTWLKQLLALTGPVTLEGYDLKISEDNYFEVLQYVIETSKENEDGPKQILKDLSDSLFEENASSLASEDVLLFILESIRDKHLSIYFFEKDMQQFADKWNLTQRMYQSDINHDYLSVIHTNVGGNKNDRWIEEEITHDTHIADDGGIEDTVSITLTHTFNAEKRRDIYKKIPALYNETPAEQERLLYILGDSPYVDFMRIYVPAESELLAVDGADMEDILVRPELNKTYFGTQLSIEPDESKTFTYTYKLPFAFNQSEKQSYEFIAQKQFGRKPLTLYKSIELAPEYVFTLETPDALSIDKQSKSFDMLMNHDQYYAVEFTHL